MSATAVLADRLRASASPRLRGTTSVPGDKSISHRALILGGMAKGETRISDLLEGQDVLHTAAAVRALGAGVERLDEGSWRIVGAPWRSPSETIDCGNSGTGVRLLMGAHQRFELLGCQLILCELPAIALAMLAMLGLAAHLTIVDGGMAQALLEASSTEP